MGYITNFIVYTLAMVGVIMVALLVLKNATAIGNGKSSKYLKIIDSISLGERKFLYIVSTGREQFLIAGDVNNTSLISKLNLSNDSNLLTNEFEQNNSQTTNYMIKADRNIQTITATAQSPHNAVNHKTYTDKSSLSFQNNLTNGNGNAAGSVMQNIAQILKK